MLSQIVAPVPELFEEQLRTVESMSPPLCLTASRRGGWAALAKTEWGPIVEVKELGKANGRLLN